MRPKPDNSEMYKEHRKHTGKCKWCQYDREELFSMCREHGVVDLSRSNRALYIVTLLVLFTYLFGILTGFVLCIEQYTPVHNSTQDTLETGEGDIVINKETFASREKVKELVEGLP